jgi:hypothetical protein
MIKPRRRWMGHVACASEMRNAYKFFVGKCEGKRPLGKLRLTLWAFFAEYKTLFGGQACPTVCDLISPPKRLSSFFNWWGGIEDSLKVASQF